MRFFLSVDPNLNVVGGEGLSFGVPEDRQGHTWVESEGLRDYVVVRDGEGQLVSSKRVPDLAEALALAKTVMRDAVKAWRDNREWAGCTTSYGPIDTTTDSQRKLSGASTAALALGAAFSKQWRMADNSLVTFDAAMMITAGLTVVAHVDGCQQRKNVLDDEIEAAADLTQLAAIDVEAGWPG